MNRRLIWVFACSGVLARAGVADAQSCVVLDEQRDTLAPEDRRAASISLAQALAKNGQAMDNQPCVAPYTVYHVKLGATISVYLYGPGGTYREGRAAKIEELPMVYEQLARAIVTNQPMSGEMADRSNATIDQMVPRRVASDDLKYVRLGYGTIVGGSAFGGPAFGFGWRHELDRFALDLSFLNLMLATNLPRADQTAMTSATNFAGTWVQMEMLYFFDPQASTSLYAGGGVGLGTTALYENTPTSTLRVSGSGLEGKLTGGIELFRSSTLRLFVEADATLPFYRCTPDLDSGSVERYAPTFLVRAGTGWGRSNTIGVYQR
jgi:hypothetical protein